MHNLEPSAMRRSEDARRRLFSLLLK